MVGWFALRTKLILFLTGIVIFSGCDQIAVEVQDAILASETVEQQRETDELFHHTQFDCIPDINSYEIADVTRIIDGDSIEVELDGEHFQVRYIGINTPEYYSKDQERAIEATKANQRLVDGKQVYLFKDRSETDKYGRLLRYVVVADDFVNLELVQEGYAEAKEYPPDTACHVVFENAEESAD